MTQDIDIAGDGVSLRLKQGDDTMRTNGRQVHLDSAPTNRHGRTYVPARAVAESLLYDVDYISEGRRVVLTKVYQAKRLIVKTDGAPLESLGQLTGATQTVKGPDNTYILQFDSEFNTKAAAEQLKSVVEYCEPDIILSTQSSNKSWGVTRIGADKYQDYLSPIGNTKQVTVAVLDTGVDISHPFLSGRLTNGWNFANGNNNLGDVNGHGTHVAGTIVDSTLNNVQIMPVKVLGNDGKGSMLIIDAGIRYAANNGADVINMSLGGYGTSQSTRDAIKYANSKGAVVVVAAGNYNDDASKYTPANTPEVITVAACDNQDRKAAFSNYGNAIDVSAPGVNINSSVPGGGYASFNGTSMVAPHVSAEVALIKSDPRFSSLTPSEVVIKVRELTDSVGNTERSLNYGYGIVNMTKAEPGTSPVSPAPTPAPTPPSGSAPIPTQPPVSTPTPTPGFTPAPTPTQPPSVVPTQPGRIEIKKYTSVSCPGNILGMSKDSASMVSWRDKTVYVTNTSNNKSTEIAVKAGCSTYGISNDHELFVISGLDIIDVVNVTTGTLTASFNGSAGSIVFSNDNKTVIGADGNKVTYYDITTGKISETHDVAGYHPTYQIPLAVNPVKNQIVVRNGKLVQIRDIYTWDLIASINTDRPSKGLIYSNDGKYLLSYDDLSCTEIFAAENSYQSKVTIDPGYIGKVRISQPYFCKVLIGGKLYDMVNKQPVIYVIESGLSSHSRFSYDYKYIYDDNGNIYYADSLLY